MKNEGVPFAIFINAILLFNLFKEKKKKYIAILLINVVIIGAWRLFILYHSLPENPFAGDLHITRLPIILVYFLKEFLNINRWGFLWIVFLITALKAKYIKGVRIFLLIISLQLFVYLSIYLTTPINPVNHVMNSFDRLLIHVTPFACYVIGVSLFLFTKKQKSYLPKWVNGIFF